MSFRTDDVTFKRVEALAEQEDRTVSKMLHILAIEALNQRECSATIRQADNVEIDMRLCSPHCRHLAAGTCFCTAVYNACGFNPVLGKTADTGRHIREDDCPYDEADFRWWQQGAVEDALARGGE
jgi:hypothetical protein